MNCLIYYRHRGNIHPGEILLEDFLKPFGITPYRLAKDLGVQQTRISEIIRGERGITPDTAMRLSRYFKTSPDVWLNLQRRYDLEQLKDIGDAADYDSIKPYDPDNGRQRRMARPSSEPGMVSETDLQGRAR